MTRLICILLTLLFSLNSSVMGEYSDFGRWSNAAKTPVNTRGFMFADNSRSAAEFTKLADDIVANGMQNKLIHYTEIGELKYVLVGNDRLRIAERLLKKTDDLIFEKVELPFRGFKTADDVIWPAMEMPENLLRGAAK